MLLTDISISNTFNKMMKKYFYGTHRLCMYKVGVFIANFEYISHLFSSVSIVNFQHVNAGWLNRCLLLCTGSFYLIGNICCFGLERFGTNM